MIFGPLIVKRHTARTYIKAFPHDAAIGFILVSRPVPGIGVPLDGYIAYKTS